MADDDYGFFTEEAPKKKRTRTKRPQARDVEQPVSPDGPDVEDDENYGFFSTDDTLETERGAPPTPAGKPSAQRPGEYRTEEPAWYEPLLSSTASFAQGAALNALDEGIAAGYWATDKLGLTNSHASYEDNQDIHKKRLDRVTNDYPYGHGAGQFATGATLGAAVPGGMLAQGLTQGALSGVSEYADSRDLGRTAVATGLGTAGGAAGAGLSNWAAKRFATVDPMQNLIRRGYMSPDDMAGAPAQNITRRGGPARELVQELEHVDPMEAAIVRKPVSSAEGEALGFRDPAPQRPLPRSPLERREGLITRGEPTAPYTVPHYEAGAYPTGKPRVPANADYTPPSHYDPEALTREAPKVIRGAGGRFQRPEYDLSELDMTPAPARPRVMDEFTAEPPPYKPNGGDWYAEPEMLRTLDVPEPAPRAFGPERPMREELVGGGVMRPRGPAEPIPLPPSEPPATRLGAVEARRAAARGPIEALEVDPPTFDLATRAQREAATPPAGVLDKALRVGSHVPGVATPSRLLRAGLGKLAGRPRMGDPGVYANETARQITRGGFEAAYEMAPNGFYGSKVNAQDVRQDAEHVAYADQATMNYALTETLHSGQTGLSQKDEQAITDAVVSGNDDVIRATDFRLRQRYPAYARRVERALKSLNEDE